jgi:hypothetical protein
MEFTHLAESNILYHGKIGNIVDYDIYKREGTFILASIIQRTDSEKWVAVLTCIG